MPGSYFWSSETYRIFGVEPSTPATLFSVLLARAPGRAPGDAVSARRPPRARRNVRVDVPHRARRWRGADASWLAQLRPRPRRHDTRVRNLPGHYRAQARRDGDSSRPEQLQLVVDTTSAFIVRFDRARRLVWANRSYAARYGKTPEELVGDGAPSISSARPPSRWSIRSARACSRGSPSRWSWSCCMASGARWVHVPGAPPGRDRRRGRLRPGADRRDRRPAAGAGTRARAE